MADLGAPARPLRPGVPASAPTGAARTRPGDAGRPPGWTGSLEHNPGDFTAVLQAGVPLAEAQAAFARDGQWLAVDPPGPGAPSAAWSPPPTPARPGTATAACATSSSASPWCSPTARSPRSGGKVIKNVAGYDLGKLFTGSYGTLGLIASVAVRLHPLPARTATVSASTDDPDGARPGRGGAGPAAAGGAQPRRLVARDGGGLLVRFGGVAAGRAGRGGSCPAAGRRCPTCRGRRRRRGRCGRQQRAAQRSADGGVVLKVSGRLDRPAAR